MQIILSVILIMACFLLILTIMIQNPKEGGLSETLGGQSSHVFGIQRTSDFLEKGTWILTIIILVSIFLFNLILRQRY